MDLNTALNILEVFIIIIAGFFFKSYLPSYFAKKGKNLATQEDIGEITREIEEVRSKYSTDIERLKSELARQSHAHQVRFEHEFEILVDVWDALIHLRKMTEQLRPILDTSEPEKSENQRKAERLRKFADAYQGLVDKVEKNRPFYPPAIYNGLVDFMQIMAKEAIYYWNHSPDQHEQGYAPKYWEEALQNSEKIISGVDDICETIRSRIAA